MVVKRHSPLRAFGDRLQVLGGVDVAGIADVVAVDERHVRRVSAEQPPRASFPTTEERTSAQRPRSINAGLTASPPKQAIADFPSSRHAAMRRATSADVTSG